MKSNIIKLKHYLYKFNIKRLNKLTSTAVHINIKKVFSNIKFVFTELRIITKI